MRVLLPLLLPLPLILVAACSGRDAAPADGVANHVGDEAAYAALKLQVLEPDAPLCRGGAQPCDVPASAGGVVTPGGDALVRVVGGRASLVALVRAGQDSAIIFGREGAGPGEYRMPAEIDLDDAGNVYVFDLFTRRLLQYSADAGLRTEGVTQLPPAPQPVMRVVNGALWMVGAEDAAARGDTLPQYVFTLALGAPAQRRHPTELRLPSYGSGEFIAMPLPFSALPQFAFGRDGRLVHAAGGTAELSLFDSTGRLVARGGFQRRGREVTPQDIEAAIAAQIRRLPSMGPMRAQIEERYRQAAERHPGVTQLLIAADGEVWAREAPEASGDSVSWLRYGPNLEPQGRVRIGVDDRVVGTHAGRVLVSRLGDDEASSGYWWMRLR